MIFSEDHELIRDSARRFVQDRIAPHSQDWERSSAFPEGIFRELGEMGFMAVAHPPEWGGTGSDYISYALMMEELAAGDGALSTVVSAQNWIGCILGSGTDEQRKRHVPDLAAGKSLAAFCLTEPGGGSDLSNMKTIARRDGDNFIINGTKSFVTTGKLADVAIVFAVTDRAARKRGVSAFLVDTSDPGYVVARVEKKMGQNASDTCEIVFQDVVVPASAMLGKEGAGLKIALSNLESGRIGIAAQCVGMARAALEIAVRYAHERQSFGKPIFEHQAVAFRLANMATQLEAARQLVLHAASLKSQGLPCLTECSMAKLFASEAAEQICSDALQTLGGAGYTQEFIVEQICRSVRVAKIYEGTSDIQHIVISRSLGAK